MMTNRKLSPAFIYTLRITAIVFIVEFLIMMFFYLFPMKNLFYVGIIDSVLLIIILSPSLYKFVYLPLLREIKYHLETQKELEESSLKLKEYSRNLEEMVNAKVKELLKISTREAVILENSNDAVITCDSDRNIVFWNRMAEEIFGYSKEEVIGKDILLIVPDQYREGHAEGFRRAIQKGRISPRKLYPVEGLRKDGTLIPVEISMSTYKSNGELLVTAIIRDITERQTSESRIKHQLDRLAALRSIDMAITASLDLRVTFNVILEQIAATIHADAADILLLNPHTLRLEYAAGRGFRTKALQFTHLRIGEGYAGKSALENRVIYISNLKDEGGDMLRAPLLSKEDFISYVCAPLISKGNIKGVVEMFYRIKCEPDPEILDFAEAIALQAAIAIDNASMFNDLQRSNLDLSLAYDTTIEGWSRALDLRDKETEGHSQRVTEMTVRIARDMGMSEEELIHVRRGALLHDIGKMGIPDNILLKPGKLNDEEWVIMRKHPLFAYELLSPISYLHSALDIPYCHHEKYDGTGYPRGLKGEQIPLAARIFSIVDVWDALRSDRPYRPAWTKEKTLEHIKSLSGLDFDPKIVENWIGTQREA